MSQAENKVIPEGYKQTEVGVIPEDWLVSNLGSIGKFKNGINKGAESFGHGLPFINLMDVFGHTQIRGDEEFGLIDSNIIDRKEYNIKEGDVLFIRSSVKPSGVGLSSVIKTTLNNTVYSGFLIRYRSNESLNTAFKEYCFYNNSFRDCVIASSTVSANTNINQDALKDLLLSYPVNLKEQTAIANALSDVDALLSELEKLIAKKQAMKNATMQQLLTGKTRLPQFAFYSDINSAEGAVEGQRKHASATNVNVGACNDGFLASQESGGMDSRRKSSKPSELGEIPEDWDIKQLKSILSLKNGYAFKGENFSDKGPIVLTPGNFKLNGGLYFEKRNTKRYKGNYPKGFEFENGDLVIVMTDLTPDCNLLGKPAFVENEDQVLHNQRIAKVSLQSHIWDRKFLYYSLLSPTYLSVIKNGATGSTVRHTSPTTILNAWVIEPPKEEQIAIATIISDMDNEIQTLEQRLSKTRQIKQGMMQELLTGKTRLPFEKTNEQGVLA